MLVNAVLGAFPEKYLVAASGMTEAVANAPGPAECFMACLPCMLSYEWIFAELVKRFPKAKDTVYGRFVNDYTGNFYDKLKGGWYDFAEKSCRNLTPARQKNCRAIFRKCSEHGLQSTIPPDC